MMYSAELNKNSETISLFTARFAVRSPES